MAEVVISKNTFSAAVERLVLALLAFFVMCHIIACLWIIQAKLANGVDEDWISSLPEENRTPYQLYVISYYFIVTTITTVGYGDFSANGSTERIICLFLMIGGVLAFSYATGSLSSIMSSFDLTKDQVNEKLQVLKRLVQRYNLDSDLTNKLKNTVKFQV